ncbi:MAG: hypothetical protein IJC71_06510 [Clostridia bacterium]|nr:hypothetical protein [Clostridia bacterium]
MAKKKNAPVDMNATFKNGMNKERTKQSAIQGLMLLVYICVLGVFSYIVSMIPAGLFGVMIAKENTTNQIIYDIQNIALCVLGLAIVTIGGWMLAKKVGENDAMFVFRNKMDRKLDGRYLMVSVVVGVGIFFVMSAVMNIDFFAGPIRYLGIFLTRAERSINEGIKVPFLTRLLAAVICLIVEVPLIIKGTRDGFKEMMEQQEDNEEEENRRAKEREEAEIAYQNRNKDKNR